MCFLCTNRQSNLFQFFYHFGHHCFCEGEGDVVGVVAPLDGVAQVIFHGAQVVEVGVHEEGEKEKDGEVQVEVKGEVEENQGQPHIMDDMQMTVTDSRTT